MPLTLQALVEAIQDYMCSVVIDICYMQMEIRLVLYWLINRSKYMFVDSNDLVYG